MTEFPYKTWEEAVALAGQQETPSPDSADGWMTTVEWGQYWHKSEKTAGKLLTALDAQGKLEMQQVHRKARNGRMCQTVVYRITP